MIEMTKSCILGMTLAIASIAADAAPAKPVDVSRLKSTNIYGMIDQKRVFVEFPAPKPATQLGLADLTVFSGDGDAEYSIYASSEKYSSLIHQATDGIDLAPMFRKALHDHLGDITWLHNAGKDDLFPGSDRSQALSWDGNAGADSVVVAELHYSLTPDYRGVVVDAVVMLYSVALSAGKYSIYEPDSKYAWLKKPVATRLCIHQSRLLPLPQKTPELVQDLLAEADEQYDAPKLRQNMDGIIKNPAASLSQIRRERVSADFQSYNALVAAIKTPAWSEDDTRLYSAMAWSKDGGAAFKQAVQEGADAMDRLIGMSLAWPTQTATTDRTIGQADGDVVYSVAIGDEPDFGIVTMVHKL